MFRSFHRPLLRTKTKKRLWSNFLQYWTLTRPLGNEIFSFHRDFRLFFPAQSIQSKSIALLNPRYYYQRWLNAHNFLYNLLLVTNNYYSFSNKLFLEESLVTNQILSLKTHKLFRFVQPFFMLKDLPHGAYIHKALNNMLATDPDFLLISDLKNHEKVLTYLRKRNIYIIGLLPSNYNPWVVSYPIPTFSDSYLVQYYFLRWILSLQSETLQNSYLIKKNLWSRFWNFN